MKLIPAKAQAAMVHLVTIFNPIYTIYSLTLMTFSIMEDADPGAEERRTVYEKGFRIWQSLYIRATQASGFPQNCFQIQPALLHHPYFPHDLDLELTYNYLSVPRISI